MENLENDEQPTDEFAAQAERAFALVGRLQRRFAARKKVPLKPTERANNGKSRQKESP